MLIVLTLLISLLTLTVHQHQLARLITFLGTLSNASAGQNKNNKKYKFSCSSLFSYDKYCIVVALP